MNMKAIHIAIAAAVALVSLSFTEENEGTKVVKIKKSQVVWKGYKVTGSHVGTIAIREGSLVFEKDKLTGGKITVDMTTITNTDQEGAYKAKLEGHLKSDDFFGVKTYPTATLVLKKVKQTGKNAYTVTGDLTIKGITKPVTFDVSVYSHKATASLKIDRAAYNVRYGSNSFFENLKDEAIYDEFDLLVELEF